MQNRRSNSGVPSTARTLEGKREEVLLVYVRGKMLLFADPNSNPKVLFYNGCKRNTVPRDVEAAHKKLLDLGLSEDAIAFRAKELALKLLDF